MTDSDYSGHLLDIEFLPSGDATLEIKMAVDTLDKCLIPSYSLIGGERRMLRINIIPSEPLPLWKRAITRLLRLPAYRFEMAQ